MGQRTPIDIQQYREQLGARLAAAASRTLGFTAEFSHWVHNDKYGYDTPVFIVPAAAVEMAQRLGLAVVAR